MGKPNPQALLNVIIPALDEIAKLTKTVDDDKAVGILRIVQAIVEALQAGVAGHVKPADVSLALKGLRDGLAQNRQRALEAVAEKFDKGDD